MAVGALQLTLTSDHPEVVVRRILETHKTFDFFQMRTQTTVVSEPFCLGQCQRWLNAEERRSQFVITGSGIAGANFTLPSEVPAVAVKVHAGSSAKRVGGFILMAAGGLLTLGGMSLALFSQQESGVRYGLGIPMAALGLGALGGSIAIVLRNRTVVQIEPTAVSP